MRHVDWILREIIEVQLHPDNMSSEDGFSLSQTWELLIHDFREQRQSHTEISTHPVGPEKA
jgi:hypothetical protein